MLFFTLLHLSQLVTDSVGTQSHLTWLTDLSHLQVHHGLHLWVKTAFLELRSKIDALRFFVLKRRRNQAAIEALRHVLLFLWDHSSLAERLQSGCKIGLFALLTSISFLQTPLRMLSFLPDFLERAHWGLPILPKVPTHFCILRWHHRLGQTFVLALLFATLHTPIIYSLSKFISNLVLPNALNWFHPVDVILVAGGCERMY